MVSSVTQVEGDLEAITEDEERIIEQREAQKEAEVDDILRDTNVTYDGLTKREVEILSTSCKNIVSYNTSYSPFIFSLFFRANLAGQRARSRHDGERRDGEVRRSHVDHHD